MEEKIIGANFKFLTHASIVWQMLLNYCPSLAVNSFTLRIIDNNPHVRDHSWDDKILWENSLSITHRVISSSQLFNLFVTFCVHKNYWCWISSGERSQLNIRGHFRSFSVRNLSVELEWRLHRIIGPVLHHKILIQIWNHELCHAPLHNTMFPCYHQTNWEIVYPINNLALNS